ncbi:putative membrane protein, partial [Escherichia coli 5905]
RRTKI